MFDRNLFLNHFNNQRPDKSYDRVVVDYQGFRWGYYTQENIYENLNSGQVMPASLFEDMNNSQSEAASASSASSSDDGGFGYSERSKNVAFEINSILRRRGGSGNFIKVASKLQLTPETYKKIRIVNQQFSKKYPLKTDGRVDLSYTILGGTPPYNETVTWYVNGGITASLPGQPKALNLLTRDFNDKFTAQITVTDSSTPTERATTLVGATGVVMQPISWSGFTISPVDPTETGSVRLAFDGLTGSPQYIDAPDPIAFPTGFAQDYYLYIGVEPEVGQTRAGPQTTSVGFTDFNLDNLAKIDNYVFEVGTGLSGAAVLSNNAQTVTANVTNTATIASLLETDLSGFTADISGTSGSASPVVLGDFAYANVSGYTLDNTDGITLSYSWYREIPTLTGITLSINI